tara:strand:- start:174 stop:905 length:732 start_codon:yes stop_codon:yes gene_type:complete
MKLFQKNIAVLFFWISMGQSQVNTEAMRNENLLPGIKNSLEIDFAYISGAKEIINLNGSYRADFVSKTDWYGFFIWKYDRAFEKSQEDFTRKGFGHLRLAKPMNSLLNIEGFTQKEFNYFLDLVNRELLGMGIRAMPKNQLYLGAGIMSETEKYQGIESQNFFKSTNYLNYSQNIFELLNLQNILYYQFKIKYPLAYRILWDGKISIQGLKNISFHINIHYRYDKESENPNYFEFSNGLGFQF